MTQTSRPKIAVVGGGTGLPVLLRGLKNLPVELSAIVTVADDGGSSGRLRKEMEIPPPGDVRNVIAALSEQEPLIIEMFQHRFNSNSELSGHSLGNLILAALTSITGDFMHAIQEMSKVLNVRGQVIPAANQRVVLNAEMDDGSIISGESKIPESGKKIKRVFLTPDLIQPLHEPIQVIREADLIVIGPGSLYTSILPNLLVPGIGEEICKAKAKKVYICNLMTQPGETLDFTASDHIEALYAHMDRSFIDLVLVNNEPVPSHLKYRYQEEQARPVVFDVDNLEMLGIEVIAEEIISLEKGFVRHDTNKVAQILYSLLPQTTRPFV
ncbi:YvcK family protein [Lederbergia sp. NSJ-179]|uniref:gluconeogenesis factor YvcK family protein n=1 Tax=Lederbergia sp. NSJ-179 TaxID=2931402 RepID=UPI001FD36E58|nr:YvcK family protein [Lederbergia sp. NSJ-179]MCJ7840218.1 YvcK family protein [Lederbergia sp. NSJ-179]